MHESIGPGPVAILRSMSPAAITVLVFLLLMSVYSIAVMIDRYRTFAEARRQSLLFVEAARKLLAQGRLEPMLEEARKHPRSHLARIYAAAIRDFSEHLALGLESGFEGTVRRATEREALLVAQEFRRGLSGLASIGATAPFVGLLGTVIGIMNAFFSMARAGQAGIGPVAGGIAEALVNTAVGLFVALPAVWAFNYFLGRIERLTVEMSNTGGELVDHFVKNHRSQAWKPVEAGR